MMVSIEKYYVYYSAAHYMMVSVEQHYVYCSAAHYMMVSVEQHYVYYSAAHYMMVSVEQHYVYCSAACTLHDGICRTTLCVLLCSTLHDGIYRTTLCVLLLQQTLHILIPYQLYELPTTRYSCTSTVSKHEYITQQEADAAAHPQSASMNTSHNRKQMQLHIHSQQAWIHRTTGSRCSCTSTVSKHECITQEEADAAAHPQSASMNTSHNRKQMQLHIHSQQAWMHHTTGSRCSCTSTVSKHDYITQEEADAAAHPQSASMNASHNRKQMQLHIHSQQAWMHHTTGSRCSCTSTVSKHDYITQQEADAAAHPQSASMNASHNRKQMQLHIHSQQAWLHHTRGSRCSCTSTVSKHECITQQEADAAAHPQSASMNASHNRKQMQLHIHSQQAWMHHTIGSRCSCTSTVSKHEYITQQEADAAAHPQSASMNASHNRKQMQLHIHSQQAWLHHTTGSRCSCTSTVSRHECITQQEADAAAHPQSASMTHHTTGSRCSCTSTVSKHDYITQEEADAAAHPQSASMNASHNRKQMQLHIHSQQAWLHHTTGSRCSCTSTVSKHECITQQEADAAAHPQSASMNTSHKRKQMQLHIHSQQAWLHHTTGSRCSCTSTVSKHECITQQEADAAAHPQSASMNASHNKKQMQLHIHSQQAWIHHTTGSRCSCTSTVSKHEYITQQEDVKSPRKLMMMSRISVTMSM